MKLNRNLWNLSDPLAFGYISRPPLSIVNSKNSANHIHGAKVIETNHFLENDFLMGVRSRNAEIIFKHKALTEVLSDVIVTFCLSLLI